jgi:hypothetical protein
MIAKRTAQALSIATVLFVVSCYKEPLDKLRKINGVTWSGTYAAPLVDAELSMEDVSGFIKDIASTQVYGDKVIYFEYSRQKFSNRGRDFFSLNGLNRSHTYTLDAGEQSSLNSGAGNVVRNETLFWDQGNSRELDSLKFSGGTLRIDLSNAVPHDAQVSIRFPDFNPPLVQTIGVPWTGSPWNRSININVSGYTARLNQGGHSNLRVEYSFNFTQTGGNPVNGTDAFSAALSTNNLSWDWVHGALGNWNLLQGSDSMKLGIFTNDMAAGKLSFNDARLKMRWANSVSAPINMSTNAMRMIMEDGSSRPVSNIPAAVMIPAAGIPTIAVRDSVYLRKTNSNVADIVEYAPHYLSWNIDANLNLPGNGRMTLFAESKFELFIALELPLSGIAKEISLSDTSEFDLGLGEEIDYIDWISFRVNVENSIPLAAGLQMVFTDNAYIPVDSLLQPYRYLIPAPNVDANGHVVQPYREVYDIKYESARIRRIADAKHVIVRITLPTSEFNGAPVPVKITTADKLRVRMGIHAKVSVKESF